MSADTTGAAVPDFTAQIALGMAWLDEHRPGWVDRVNVDSLQLSNCTCCVLGQLDGNFTGQRDDVPTTEIGGEWWPKARWANPLGFSGAQGPGEWHALTAQWKAAILARRGEVTP